MRLFLYFGERYRSWVPFVPEDLAERLREFVPPPPEAALPSHEDLPEAVSRRVHRPWEEPRPPARIPLIRRDMERAAAQDLLTVLRQTSLGRIAVSARTGRASAAGLHRIAEALDRADFIDPAAGEAPAGQAAVGPIRAFAWPLLQAGKLAGADDAKS